MGMGRVPKNIGYVGCGLGMCNQANPYPYLKPTIFGCRSLFSLAFKKVLRLHIRKKILWLRPRFNLDFDIFEKIVEVY